MLKIIVRYREKAHKKYPLNTFQQEGIEPKKLALDQIRVNYPFFEGDKAEDSKAPRQKEKKTSVEKGVIKADSVLRMMLSKHEEATNV
jgi:hypothetical protein